MVHLPGRSGSPLSSTPEVVHPQHPPSAYQITIDGQPAFLVPHLDAQHATLQTAETTITKGETTSCNHLHAAIVILVWLEIIYMSVLAE